jgi:hypothetical protein
MRIPYSLLVIVSLVLVACKTESEENSETKNEKSFTCEIAGTYVSSQYFNRKQGYDWMAVVIEMVNDSTAKIKIRSRIDIKKPTCTWTTFATCTGDNLLTANFEGTSIEFEKEGDDLEIRAKEEGDEGKLHYFCSGGGSIAGMYKLLKDSLDESTLDQREYSQMLNAKKYSFDIWQIKDSLYIQTYGLTYAEVQMVSFPYEINKAELGDLDKDGFPEVYISGVDLKSTKGQLFALSVNKGKSTSIVSVEELSNKDKRFTDYKGSDEFAVVESKLERRYPVGAGKYQQIQYELVKGETSPQLKIKKIISF